MTRNNRVRECKYTAKWNGFNMKPGFIYGSIQSGEVFVWTGKVRNKKRHDGSVCGKEIMIFRAVPTMYWETPRPTEWHSEWVSCGSGIGKKILEKSTKTQKIIPDYRPKGRSEKGFYFKSDKSRYPTYTADAWRYQNK